MKTTPSPSKFPRGASGMTLAEMMTSLAIFMLIMAGLLSAIIFGMRQDELVNSSLGANDQSRVAFNLMLDEIRSCKNVQIGNGYYSNFTALTNGSMQGPALQIIPSTNQFMYIYYWFDTNAGVLWRASYSNALQSSVIVAQYLTNQTSTFIPNSMTFRAMDYTGTTNLTVDPTNYNYNYVINILMQFYMYQYPQTTVGTNSLFDYYQLSYSATRRSP